MRKRLWQLHSWLGLIAGLGLLVIGLTGSLLVFHDELESVLNPTFIRVEPADHGRLPFDMLFTESRRQLPDHIVAGWSVRTPAEATYADVLYVVRRGTTDWNVATLNPYTGQVLAAPRKGTETFTGWLLELHYAFFTDHAGMAVAGLFAVVLCLLGVTGVWIYREFWKHLFTLRWGRGARILFSDLHKFTGITSVCFNLLLGFTGAYWNLTHIIGEWINGEPMAPKMEQPFYAATISPDTIVRDAVTRLPGYRANFISFPSMTAMDITLYGTLPTRNPLRGPYGSTLAYDAQTGAFKTATDIRSTGLWAQFVDMFVPLHYGTFGGLPVKILWSIGGLTPGILAITGFCIWCQRRKRHEAGPQIVSNAPSSFPAPVPSEFVAPRRDKA